MRRGASPELADSVVADLAARGYVDDASFARQWVETRAARGYGAARLRAELRARGIAAALVDAAVAVIDGEAGLRRARALAERRLAVLRRSRPERAAARLADYLRRRGYSSAVTARVVRETLGAVADD